MTLNELHAAILVLCQRHGLAGRAEWYGAAPPHAFVDEARAAIAADSPALGEVFDLAEAMLQLEEVASKNMVTLYLFDRKMPEVEIEVGVQPEIRIQATTFGAAIRAAHAEWKEGE